jgi:DNA sulfur modification protein DndD
VKLKTAAPEELQQQLESNLKQAQAEFLKTQTEKEYAQEKLDKIGREIAKTKKELETYSEKSLEYKNNEHIIYSIDKVQETLKLFKEKLTLKKLNKLEGEVTECFRYLLHKSDLVHRVTIDTHNFSLSLYDPQGKPLPKHRLSAGEKQLLAIAFLWGLARVSGRNLPVAIDTPLGRLDSSHRHNLVERYFPAASHQVILLSTDTEIDQKQVHFLREMNAISQEYLLKYDPKQRQTTIEKGYFW